MDRSRRNLFSKVPIEYFSGLMLKSKEYEELKAKFENLTRRNLGRSTSHSIINSNRTLENLNTRVKIYEKELENISLRTAKSVNSEVFLQKTIEKQLLKVSELEKENARLNQGQKLLPKITNVVVLKSTVEEAYREVKKLKAAIKSTEEQLVNNRKVSKQRHEQFLKLVQKHENLRLEVGDYVRIFPDRRYFKLQKKLEVITTSWKNNVVKYEILISEMEEEIQELKKSCMHLNAKAFKKTQQERLLKMSYDEVVVKKSEGALSSRPDIDHPGVGFMYTPSVKGLYNI